MGVNITTIAYLRVLIIEIGSTIIFMVVEAQGKWIKAVLDRIPLENYPFGVPPTGGKRSLYIAGSCRIIPGIVSR